MIFEYNYSNFISIVPNAQCHLRKVIDTKEDMKAITLDDGKKKRRNSMCKHTAP
jgi:GH25 family lysozyme M1 (1,4-beta-N-acetylmuramidase)